MLPKKKKYRKGTKILIKINGKPIETKIDENGYQRLPRNHAIDWLCMYSPKGPMMNELWKFHAAGGCTKQEMREIYQNIGYSVCGYSEMFPNDKIENPVWEEESANATD